MPGDIGFNLVEKKTDVLPLVPLTAHTQKRYTHNSVPVSWDVIVDYLYTFKKANLLVTRQVGTSDDGSQKTRRSVLGNPTAANASRTLWPKSFKPYREKERGGREWEVEKSVKKYMLRNSSTVNSLLPVLFDWPNWWWPIIYGTYRVHVHVRWQFMQWITGQKCTTFEYLLLIKVDLFLKRWENFAVYAWRYLAP